MLDGEKAVKHNTRNKELYKQIEAYNKKVVVSTSGQQGQAGQEVRPDDFGRKSSSFAKIYFYILVTFQSTAMVFFIALFFAYEQKALWAQDVLYAITNIIK